MIFAVFRKITKTMEITAPTAEIYRRVDFGFSSWKSGQARKGAASPWTSDARVGRGGEKECGV